MQVTIVNCCSIIPQACKLHWSTTRLIQSSVHLSKLNHSYKPINEIKLAVCSSDINNEYVVSVCEGWGVNSLNLTSLPLDWTDWLYICENGAGGPILLLILSTNTHTYTIQHPHSFDIRMLGLIFHIDEVEIKNKREVRTELNYTWPSIYTDAWGFTWSLCNIAHSRSLTHSHTHTI